MPNLSLKDLSYFGGFFCQDDLENVLKKLSLEKYKSVFEEQEVITPGTWESSMFKGWGTV